jgi:hypothetical protein
MDDMIVGGDTVGQRRLSRMLAWKAGQPFAGEFAGARPERTPEFTHDVNSMPNYVVTTTLDEFECDNSTPDQGATSRGGGRAGAALAACPPALSAMRGPC